jgi:RNA polymerase sigma factor (sigma-70 family)
MLKREAGLSGLAKPVLTEDGERLCALVRDAGAGDERAWAELVDRYDRLVRHVVRAHGIDVSTSEDIVQVTWCRLVQNLDLVRQPERLGAWLARTARNECLHVLRGWGRETPVEEEALRSLIHELGDDTEDDIDAAGLEELVMRAFHTLDDEQRGLLRLVLLTEPKPSYEQIGAALGRPVGSIGPTLGRCIDKLRRATLRLSEADAAAHAPHTLSRVS